MPSPKTELRIINAIHCIQLVLAGAALGIGLYKMFFSKDRSAARTGRWALSVAAKSLVIISYQLMTENIKAIHRYASLKAFFILDILEVGFWIAAIVLTAMGMIKTCTGLNCILSGVVIGLAVILAILGLPLVWIAFKHWQYYKKNGHRLEDSWKGCAQSPGNDAKTHSLDAGQTPFDGSEITHGGVSFPMRTTFGDRLQHIK